MGTLRRSYETSRHEDPAPSPELLQDTRLVRVLTLCLFAAIVVVLAIPFFSKLSWTTLVQDDFFYYLVVARNIVEGHGSTFNGIVPTNGYQPLWLWVLVCVSWVSQSPRFILGFVALSSLVSAAVTFVLARRMLSKTGASPLLVFAFAAWTTVLAFLLYIEAMEVTLTVPLMFAVVCMLQETAWLERSQRNTFLLGLALAAMVLSRVDSLIFGFLLLAGILLLPALRVLVKPRLAAGAILGFLPVPAYFVYNHLVFHSWLPVSGAAKQLKLDHSYSRLPVLSFMQDRSVMHLLIVLPILLSLFFLPKAWRRLGPMARVCTVSVLLFPVVYYAVLGAVSDWGLFPWYAYGMRLGFCIAAVICCLALPSLRFFERPAVVWILIVSSFAYLLAHHWKRTQLDNDEAALRTREFALTHPGIYAMGDRAGRVGYMLPDPLIQLEGLVMDKDYLTSLQRQLPLREVLARYRVRYYIATEYNKGTAASVGCFNAVEPYMAGPHCPHLHGVFCETPVAVFPDAHKRTVIFDLAPESSSAAGPAGVTASAAR
jgi:hypothetical protein